MKSHFSQSSFVEVDNLWKSLTEGDKNGLEGLYKYFSRALFQHGLSLIADQDFVQDCIQEVFIDIWKYHKSLPKAENVKLYLFRSLSHKIFREAKKAKKGKTNEAEIQLEMPIFTESRENELIGIQRDEQLQKKMALAINKLPIRQNEVLQYLFFENFSYEETSKVMGINLRSVYTLAWKAILRLKKSYFLFLLLLAV